MHTMHLVCLIYWCENFHSFCCTEATKLTITQINFVTFTMKYHTVYWLHKSGIIDEWVASCVTM